MSGPPSVSKAEPGSSSVVGGASPASSSSFRLPVRSIVTVPRVNVDPSRQIRTVRVPRRVPATGQTNDWREEINREIALCEFYDRLPPLKQQAFKKMMTRMGETMPAPILQSRPQLNKRDLLRPRSPLMIPARLLKSYRGNADEVVEPDIPNPSPPPPVVPPVVHHQSKSSPSDQSFSYEPMNNITQLSINGSTEKPVVYMPNFRPADGPPEESRAMRREIDPSPTRQTQIHREFQENLKTKTTIIVAANREPLTRDPTTRQPLTSESRDSNEPRKLIFKRIKFPEADLKRAYNSPDLGMETAAKIKKEWDETDPNGPPVVRAQIMPPHRMNPTIMKRIPASRIQGSYYSPIGGSSANSPRKIPTYLTLKHSVPPPSAAIKLPVMAMPLSRPNFKRVPMNMELDNEQEDEDTHERPPPELRDTINANPFADIQPIMGSEPIDNPRLAQHLNRDDDDEFESPSFPGGTIEQALNTPARKTGTTKEIKEEPQDVEEDDEKILPKTRVIQGITYHNCPHCKTLLKKSQAINHQKNFEANGSCEPVRRRYQCPYVKCDEDMLSMEKYCIHLQNEHDKPCEIKEKEFKNHEEYEIFRAELEATGNFRVTRGFKPASEGAATKYFSCGRFNKKAMHGETNDDDEGIVFSDDDLPCDSKQANPCLTKKGALSFAKGKVCTAFYRLTTFQDGSCHIRYCDHHLHAPVVLRVPEDAKARIRELGLRLPVPVVLMVIKAEAKRFAAGGSPAYERILQIASRDVRNILAMAKIKPIKVKEFNADGEGYGDLELPSNLPIDADDSDEESSDDEDSLHPEVNDIQNGTKLSSVAGSSKNNSTEPISETALGVIERMKLLQWQKEIPKREADANRRRSIAYHRNMKKREIHSKFLNIAARGQPYIVGKCTSAEMEELDSLAKSIEKILDKVMKRNMAMVKQLQDAEQIEIEKKKFLNDLCTEMPRKETEIKDDINDEEETEVKKPVAQTVKEKPVKEECTDTDSDYSTKQITTRGGRVVKMKQFH